MDPEGDKWSRLPSLKNHKATGFPSNTGPGSLIQQASIIQCWAIIKLHVRGDPPPLTKLSGFAPVNTEFASLLLFASALSYPQILLLEVFNKHCRPRWHWSTVWYNRYCAYASENRNISIMKIKYRRHIQGHLISRLACCGRLIIFKIYYSEILSHVSMILSKVWSIFVWLLNLR